MSIDRAWRKSLPWLGIAIIAVAVLVLRLQMSFDISAFFPQKLDLTHNILLQQFKSGPGSRLLVIGISGGDEEQLAESSDRLRSALEGGPLFTAVLNGEVDEEASVPEPVASRYPLMRDIDYGREALRRAIESRLADLAFGGGTTLLELMARDPYLATLDILERLSPVESSGEMWFAADGSAVLMAETRATAVDIAGQAAAIDAVRDAFSSIDGTDAQRLEMTGAGAFGVELQATIRQEATRRSALATAGLFLVLLLFYRKPRYLLLATVPIGMGFLAGLAVVSLVFDSVHGITLAFGFTLMGVAIDYPLHLFSHAEQAGGESAIRGIWPTMRLGAISTAVAYIALAFSGSDGLAQLGVFTAAGIAVAVLATRTWVPYLLGSTPAVSPQPGRASAVNLSYLPALLLAAAALVVGMQTMVGGLWDDRLTSLSPVPEQRLLRDNVLRSAAGTPDMRYQLMVHDASLDALLEKNEALDRRLAGLAAEGGIAGWQSVTQLLPSIRVQQRRRDAIPGPDELRLRLDDVLGETPFRGDAFDPFIDTAARVRDGDLISLDDFENSPLRSWLDSRLVQLDDQWVSIVSLRAPRAEELRETVRDWGEGVALLDLRDASMSMMQDYRHGALETVAIAAFIILVLLWAQRRELRQVLWIASSVTVGLVVTIVTVTAVHGQLTVIHLVALLLVLGLGLDYALFLSRRESPAERRATHKAVLACAASTTLAFGILAGSSIPVLKFLGLTVAAGSTANYLLAVAGTRRTAGAG